MKRKACRREVKATLERVGLEPPPIGVMSQDDVTRRFITTKCLACLRCPRLCQRLAANQLAGPRDILRPPGSLRGGQSLQAT